MALGLSASTAAAQNFSQTVFFGDSNTDNGYFRNDPNVVAQGGWGKPTTFPGPMWSDTFARLLGLSAEPSNSPGGTNYAASGAQVNIPGVFGVTPIPTVKQQINTYLASTARADPNALYSINIGTNDVRNVACNVVPSAACTAFIQQTTADLVASIIQLKAAGAQYVAVHTLRAAGADAAERGEWNRTLFAKLAAQGVNVIPIDYGAIVGHVINQAAAYGITVTNAPACVKNNAVFCAPHEFAPGAAQIYLQSDQTGHLGAAAQRIVGDYVYSVITAPSQMSMLAERAVQERANLVGQIQTQLPLSWQNTGALGLNAWIGGNVSKLAFDNYDGFPDGDPIIFAGTVGADKIIMPGVLLGAAVTVGGGKRMEWGPRSDGRDLGSFDQEETAVSIYAAVRGGPWNFHVIGTYGWLEYETHRITPLGNLDRNTNGETNGHNRSVAAQLAYDFKAGRLTHGPVAGVLLQRVDVDGFRETGNVNALIMQFHDQIRRSTVSELGWRFSYDAGRFKPFASVTWNHEFEDTRMVTASLTSSTFLPSFSLPAVSLGEDWVNATVGTSIALAPQVTGVIAATGHVGRDSLTNAGVRIGLSAGF